eukprot:896307-Rhodomonas_salina.1
MQAPGPLLEHRDTLSRDSKLKKDRDYRVVTLESVNAQLGIPTTAVVRVLHRALGAGAACSPSTPAVHTWGTLCYVGRLERGCPAEEFEGSVAFQLRESIR